MHMQGSCNQWDAPTSDLLPNCKTVSTAQLPEPNQSSGLVGISRQESPSLLSPTPAPLDLSYKSLLIPLIRR
jgi:hypothetical protein